MVILLVTEQTDDDNLDVRGGLTTTLLIMVSYRLLRGIDRERKKRKLTDIISLAQKGAHDTQ